MQPDRISLPSDLTSLQPSDALERISISTLARTGTAVLQRLLATDEAVAVNVQGMGAMVTLSQRQYDEMVALIQCLQDETPQDEFTKVLGQRFDRLITKMNQPEATQGIEEALFGDPAELNRSYQPGATETDH